MTLEIDPAAMDQIAQIYLVANTPTFLFKHVRRHPYVERLAERLASHNLNDLAARFHNLQEFTDSSVLELYILIGALSLQRNLDTVVALRALKNLPVRWTSEMAELAAAQITRDNESRIDLGYRSPKLVLNSASDAPSIVSTINHRLILQSS